MQCPHCSSEVPPGPTCPRCGLPLPATPNLASIAGPMASAARPAAQPGAASPATVPLTAWQMARLTAGCLPLLFFLLALVFCLTFFDDIYGVPPATLLLLFLGVVILVTGYQALQRVRDLASGIAMVQEDRLERLWRPRRGKGQYGKFARLGTLSMRQRDYVQSQLGHDHRVIYSPASKIAWSVEPLRGY